MQLCRNLVIIFLCLFLQACCCVTSPCMSQELELGKWKFKNGEYKQAFCNLLPVAANGNAEAQYAVGYMYYYGYGVPRDCDSGLFWMTRSANQHFCPAIHALDLIKQGPPPCIEKPPVYDCYQKQVTVYENAIPDKDAVLKCVRPACGTPDNPCGIPKTHTPPYHAPIASHTCAKPVKPSYSEWQDAAPAQSLVKTPVKIKTAPVAAVTQSPYSLQLFGAYHLADVKKVQEKLHLEKTTFISHTQNKGKDWYILTYGHYATVSDAKSVIGALPMQAQELGPWVRKLA